MKIGVIGVGNIGFHHARIVSEQKNASLAGVYDSDKRKAEKVANLFNTKSFTSLEKLIDSSDALILATPTPTHIPLAIECIERSKPVLIEKPIASSLEEAQQFLEKARKLNAKVMVGHVERFNPVIREIKKILKRELPLMINIKRVGPLPPQIKETGVIVDIGIHDIDILMFATDQKPELVSCIKGFSKQQKFEDFALISFKLPNGCLSQIIVNWLTPFKIREIEIATSEAYYRGDLITQKLTRFKRNNRTGAVSMFDFPISYREPLKQEIESFISYIKSETSSPVSIEEAIENLKVAIQCLNC